MEAGSELLPKPPFDVEQEALVTSSVELSADRLQSMVAWLVSCIRDNQKRILRNERRLNQLGMGVGIDTKIDPILGEVPAMGIGSLGPAGTPDKGLELERPASQGTHQGQESLSSAPPVSASVSSALQSSMREELLLMQINTVKHEVSALPKMADLERQRERTAAEMSSLSDDVSERLRESQEKVQSVLATATEDLHAQLERISEDVIARLEALEARSTEAEAAAKSAATSAAITAAATSRASTANVTTPQSRGMGAFPATPEAHATDAASAASVGMHEASPDAAAAADDTSPASADVQAAAAGAGAEGQPAAGSQPASSTGSRPKLSRSKTGGLGSPPSPAGSAIARRLSPSSREERRRGRDRPSSRTHSQGSPDRSESTDYRSRRSDQRDKFDDLDLGRQDSKTRTELRPGVTLLDAGPAAGTPSVDGGPNSAGGVYSVVTDPAMFDFASQVSDLRGITERQAQEIEALRAESNEDVSEVRSLAENLDDLIRDQVQKVMRMEMDMDEMRGMIPTEDKTRREWMEKAACRKEQREKDMRLNSPTSDRRRSDRRTESPDGGRGNSRGNSRASSRAVSPKAGSQRSSPARASDGQGPLGDDPSLQLVQRLDLIEDTHLPELQEEITSRTEELEGEITDIKKSLLPIRSIQDSMGEFEKWQHKMEKKMRRLSPLDSQWADVQEELERFRKLFEFLEGLIPSEASEAMRFFNRRFEEQKKARQEAARNMFAEVGGGHLGTAETDMGKASKSTFVSYLAEPLGPEVALDRHRAVLEEEVRNHEQQMRGEFSNLSLAIKSLQKETGQIANKMVDLLQRLVRVEDTDRVMTPTTSRSSPSPMPGVDTEKPTSPPSERPAPPPAGDASAFVLTKLPGDASHTHEDVDKSGYVSKIAMNKALENCKEDFRGWLDVLHEQIIQALQQKADNNQVNSIIQRLLSQAVGLESEQFALLAKRALLGRCASCDAHLNVDASKVQRPVPVSSPPPWNAKAPAGAPLTVRPPGIAGMSGNQAGFGSAGKLPKIKAAGDGKDSGRGRIAKNSSQPDLRKWKLQEPE
mmetsp:Transcript_15419/g.28348  ORF Transcript_15419/g.28348 Transcript_15419/m.28348 type:complete len:1050 (-) Transcript_15419:107-3256(-)